MSAIHVCHICVYMCDKHCGALVANHTFSHVICMSRDITGVGPGFWGEGGGGVAK